MADVIGGLPLPVQEGGQVQGDLATPVYVTDEAVTPGSVGGAALPIYAVSDADIASGKFKVKGGPALPVMVSRSATRLVQGGPAVPVRQVGGPGYLSNTRIDRMKAIAPASHILYIPGTDPTGSTAKNYGGAQPYADRDGAWIGTTPESINTPWTGKAHQFDAINDCLNAWSASLASLWNWAAWTVILAYKPTNVGVWTNGLARNLLYFRNSPFSSIVQQTKHSTNGQIGFQMRIGGNNYNYYHLTASPTNFIMVGTSYRQAATRLRHFYSAQAFGATPAVAPTMVYENTAAVGSPSGALDSDGATIGAYSAVAPSGVIDGYECEISVWNDELDFTTQIAPAMRI